jgi:hypothetical protein
VPNVSVRGAYALGMEARDVIMCTRIESKSWFWTLVAVATLLASAPAVGLGNHLLRCHHCGKHCQTHQLVEKTVMVPKKVIEIRGKNCVVMKNVEREEKYTVFVMKPDKRAYKKPVCYLDDEVKEQVITKIEPKLVSVPVNRVNHLKVPGEPVCSDELRCHEECTKCGPVCVCEVCPVEKTYLVDSVDAQLYNETQLVIDKSQCNIAYCVKTPKSYTIPCAEEEYFHLVPVERTRKVTVCIPKIEKQNIEVEVTKMVPCKIFVCEACKQH